jgi:hypothetical protein
MLLRVFSYKCGVCQECDCFEPLWLDIDTATWQYVDGPALCDDCNTRRRVHADFAEDRSFAERIYCSRSAEDYLQSIGL